MHEFVSFNRRIFHSNQAKISGISSASLYGCGVFTSLAIYNFTPFLWEKHWSRLTENAARIGVDLSAFSESAVFDSLSELIAYNKVRTGRARVTFFDESSTGIWQTETKKETSLLIMTGDFRETPKTLNLTVSPYRVNTSSPLVNTKSGNYLENLLAWQEAKKRGFSEAVRLNERNEIVSGCMANIFWVKRNNIFTPGSETGILRGTTRSFIFDNFTVYEEKASLERLIDADDIFLTSAGLEIAKIETFKARKIVSSTTFKSIKKLFDEFKTK